MSWIRGHVEFAALAVSMLVILVSISATYGVNQHSIRRHEAEVKSIKRDSQRQNDILVEVRNDVKWLRLKFTNDK